VSGLLPVATRAEALTEARRLLRGRRGVLAGAAVAFVAQGLAGLVAPYALGRLVDLVRDGGTHADLVAPVVAIAVAALVGGAATIAAVALLARAVEPALAELREEVLDRAVHLDFAEVERTGTGDLMARVGDDVRAVSDSVGEAVPLVVSSAVAVVLTAAGLFVLDWRLGLAGLVALPMYATGLRWYLPRSGPYYAREREANGVRAGAILTAVHGHRTLRAHGWGARQQERVVDASWTSAQIQLDVWHMLLRFFGRNNRAELVGLLAVLVTGFFSVRAGAVSVGDVTAAALLFHRLFNPIGALMGLFDQVQSASASFVRLVGLVLVRRPVDVRTRGRAALELVGVRHAYVEDRPVLHDVSLTVAAGERVALVGASGAGKSTLGVIAAGLVAPTSGVVRSDGPPLLVTQEVHTYVGTVRENLTLSRSAADQVLLDALARTGAERWVGLLPNGLDTVVGEGGHPLTAAQAQQLALTRVLVADPAVVVLDEATAEAGSAGARDLEAAALAVTEGRAALVIAHRLTQARTADRVVVLERGRVLEEGSHDELLALGGRYAELWSAWSGHSVPTPSPTSSHLEA
jgi:ABC-type multidrug transport system fused ATPase/permease subunit